VPEISGTGSMIGGETPPASRFFYVSAPLNAGKRGAAPKNPRSFQIKIDFYIGAAPTIFPGFNFMGVSRNRYFHGINGL
jgi:hypothetical protein